MATRSDTSPDPLDLGERILAILQQGQKISTYKLARTLSALVEYCLANVPADPMAPLDVPIEALADGVMRLYWQQVLPFPTTKRRLQQSSQEKKKPLDILTHVERLRAAVGEDKQGISFASAQVKAEKQYKRARSAVATTLRRYPLRLLQRLPSGGGHASSEAFLYDDTWMNGSREEVAAHRGVVRLRPGVATALARLSGLLIPTINVLWVEKVQDLNPAASENVPDFEGYLFGRDKAALKRAGNALKKAFGAQCFYCHKRITTDLDHVLPWSRAHIDSLANLVPACRTCNGDKSGLLPAPNHVEAALMRDHAKLDAIAETLNWPAEYDYVRSVARGLYDHTRQHSDMVGREQVATIPAFTRSKVAPSRLTHRGSRRQRSNRSPERLQRVLWPHHCSDRGAPAKAREGSITLQNKRKRQLLATTANRRLQKPVFQTDEPI